jgi:hypothetical protein
MLDIAFDWSHLNKPRSRPSSFLRLDLVGSGHEGQARVRAYLYNVCMFRGQRTHLRKCWKVGGLSTSYTSNKMTYITTCLY